MTMYKYRVKMANVKRLEGVQIVVIVTRRFKYRLTMEEKRRAGSKIT
mgnify:CR=1 FL=1